MKLRFISSFRISFPSFSTGSVSLKRNFHCQEVVSLEVPIPSTSSKKPILSFDKGKSSGESLGFIDFCQVTCIGGTGGNGCISFLREYNVPFGGPDGGNGGNGGHVIFKACDKTGDLSNVPEVASASGGQHGHGKCCHGKNAGDMILTVPMNTIIRKPNSNRQDPDAGVIYELVNEGQIFIAARGGAGGHGNNFYLSNMIRKPLKAELGGKGERSSYDLEMKVMATAGLVGYPNAGKSTLLRAISRARPKVAYYPFTTLKPHVGMVQYGDFVQVPVADIPGLVEDSKNHGLGHGFLQNVSRCQCLFFVIDYTLGQYLDQFNSLRHELNTFSPRLLEKNFAVLLNKIDLLKNERQIEQIKQSFSFCPIFFISGKTGLNLVPLLIFLRDQHDALQIEMNRIANEEQQNSMI